MITVVDYGVGNLVSIQNMLKKCGLSSQVCSNGEQLANASKLILPGVGAFDTAMKKINESGLYDAILDAAGRGTFILGICLGAQLLLEGSEEGNLPGLSLIKGKCRKFDAQVISPLRVPHMGWNDVVFNSLHPLGNFDNVQPRFYFTHSYYLNCDDKEHQIATSIYGHPFASAIAKENIMGVQFHPEKSHAFGLRLLTNFGRM